MKKYLAASVASVFMLAAGSANALDVRLSHSQQADLYNDIHQSMWFFKNYLEEKLPNVNVTIHPFNELGQEREVYEAMQLGTGASCSISGTAILNNFSKKMGVVDLPYIWSSYDHIHTVLDGEIGDELRADLRSSGIDILAFLDSWGARHILTHGKPVTSPEELAGLKIRTIPTKTYVETIKAMGANATPMAFGEVYTAMETGVIDGLEQNASVAYGNKFYEVTEYLTKTNHLFGTLVLACSSDFMNRLDDDQRAKVQEAANLARDAQRGLALQREAETMELLEKAGMKIHEIDVTPFRDTALEVQDRLAEELGATEILAKIREQG
ncbi:TRAP transporter substrate-binding protein [Rhodobacteraceae bacterium RKSG542]|uniref:TRAP transporter substrate-binding protein n=1 Tax=Pseudovibrio flavus TaxID=2529854 RepID=UPI0012BD4529|nr:TRAP transporter substrate-binding protein [Pseudovibrio flavus]MTI18179.1 TRAP transporter substrate-binding protein [Pseudovibrio flavus]